MHKEPDEKMIGLFMIVAIGVFMAIIAVFFKQKLFSGNDSMVVMYFDESIKGLNVGSSVVFKGVEIGKVAKIDLLANAETLDFSIPVYVKMETGQQINAGESYDTKQAVLDALIEKGLRARLTTQSYLTGQLMIELEMLPDTKISLKNHDVDDHILEIPTVLSPMGELSRGIQNLPVRQSVEEFNAFFETLNKQLPILLPKINQTVNGLNKFVGDNSDASARVLNNLNRAILNVGEAAKAFRNFSDYIERHPEALLKGKTGK